MSQFGDFDPFAAWQKFQVEQDDRRGKKRLNEAINPGQLHDPKDFVQKLRELSAETASNCAALEQFVESHKGDPEWQSLGTDELTEALGKLSESANDLAQWVGPIEKALNQKEQQEEMHAQKESGPGYGGGALFKK